MLKSLYNGIKSLVLVGVAGFLLGVFTAALLLPVFTTWKFVFNSF